MTRRVLLPVFILASLLFTLLPAAAQSVEQADELTTLAIDTDPNSDKVGLVDPVTGIWYLRGQGGVVGSFFYGNPGDVPFVGDWNCDGIDTPGLYRQSDGFVYLRNSNTQGPADIRFFFGNPGDFPLAGDFDNDGCDSVSIYRSSEQRIYIINELGANDGGLGAAEFSYIFGNPGDKPFVGDFNGDGIDTVGLHRESTGFVYFRQSHTQGIADAQFFFGDPGDRFVTGDWGIVNGVDTPGLFRPSNSIFYFRYSNTQGIAEETLGWGVSNYLPIAGFWGPVTPGGPGTPPPGGGPGGPGGPGTPLPLSVTGPLPNALISTFYSANLTVTGGVPPYTVQKLGGPAWAVVSGVNVAGTVAAPLGVSNLQVLVTDSAGAQASAVIPINVINGCEGNVTLPPNQCLALVELYKSTGGAAWTENTGWLTGDPCTPWLGISCGAGGVTAIELSENNLTGSLPTAASTVNHLGVLTGLAVFNAEDNSMGGAIPAEVGGILSLTHIDLSDNFFIGSVPTGFWTHQGIVDIDLGANGLTGQIPAGVNMSALQILELQFNNLDGAIPDVILPAITSIELNDNGFSGPLAEFWTLPTLTNLVLSHNLFSGPVSANVGLLTNLETLMLEDNLLGGPGNDLMPNAILPLPLTAFSSNENCGFTPESVDVHNKLFPLDPAWNETLPCP